MTTNPFDPDYVMSEEFKRESIEQLRIRWDEMEKRRERAARRRRRLHRLSFGLLGR
jgi:hypothetical protein